MINGVDYAYLWHNDKEYKRLTFDDLNDDGALLVAEAMLSELREVYEGTARSLHNSAGKDDIASANALLRILRGEQVNGLTLGHGQEVADRFLNMCPEYLIQVDSKGERYIGYPKEDGKVANGQQFDTKTVVA